ncbi:MAG TPA: DUF2680 domain-containing protein [Spirochaetia bacterium]|nr:DUF2680 domain-containing protein [Spirochaetia bacterium]
MFGGKNKQKVLTLQEQAINQAMSNGKLTQDQANKMIQRLEQRLNNTTSSAPSGTIQS